jgi:ribosomal subunit interface protein
VKINIKKTNDLVTAPLEQYIEEKLLPLAKYIKHFDETGEAEIWLEISRTTNHHKKGDVYLAAADLRLPHQILRAEESADDIHKAIDAVKDKLHGEIEKYKAKSLGHRR